MKQTDKCGGSKKTGLEDKALKANRASCFFQFVPPLTWY